MRLTFQSIGEFNEAIEELIRAYNQRRMQQVPFTREECFLSLERPAPAQDFEIKSYASLKVGYNCCVYLGRDRHYYSVPHQLVGKQTQVIYTRSLVKIFCDGDCVAVHKRDRGPESTPYRKSTSPQAATPTATAHPNTTRTRPARCPTSWPRSSG